MATKKGLFIYVFALNGLCSIFFCCATQLSNDAVKKDDALSFVNAVQKRYYVIRRLESSFETLMASYQKFCGPCVKCGCSLDAELKRVNRLWQDCVSYKSIMDDAQTRELLMHLVVLYDALLRTCGATGTCHTRSMGALHSISDLIEEVDLLAFRSKTLPGAALRPYFSLQMLFPDSYQEVFFAHEAEQGVEPDDTLFERLDAAYQQGEFVVNTTVRFYMIQRIAPSVDALLALGSHLKPGYRDALALCGSFAMKSPAARECVERLKTEKSLEPLKVFWQNIGAYRYIGDSYVIRECLIIVVHVYQLLMRYLSPEIAQIEATEEDVMSLYTSISSLPLPELLSLLDELTEQSSTLVTVYQQGVTQGWKSTLKHYWWVPPVLVAGCASLYLRVKKLLGHTSFRPVAESLSTKTSS